MGKWTPPIAIRQPCYPKYHMNGYNFRQSIQDPDSRLRVLLDLMERQGTLGVTKLEFHIFNGDDGAITDDGRLRPGWGNTFWTALKNANIISWMGDKTPSGQRIYHRGIYYYDFLRMAKFFTKSSTEVVLIYE